MIQKVSQSPRVFHFKRLLSMGVFAFDHHPRSVERTFIHFNTSTPPRRRSKSVVPILGRWRAWGQPVDVGEGRATNQPFFSRVPSRNQWSLISQAKWKMDINGIKMAKIWGDRSVFFFPRRFNLLMDGVSCRQKWWWACVPGNFIHRDSWVYPVSAGVQPWVSWG